MNSGQSIAPKRYRLVSELRVQFICEYRLYLEKQHCKRKSESMRRGLHLHEMASNAGQVTQTMSSIVKYVLLFLIVVAGLAWILG
jgi:hypothetical protein